MKLAEYLRVVTKIINLININFMEKKYLNLRGITEILSEKEMRNVIGSSGGAGSGSFYPTVLSYCCLEGDPDDCFTNVGSCAGPDCETCMNYPLVQVGYFCVNKYCWIDYY